MKITGLTGFVLLAALHAGGACAADDAVFGFWMVENKGAIIEIVPCDGKACGNIVWLLEPLDDSARPKIDSNNTDEGLRQRPLCGISLIRKFKNAGLGVWSGGSIYSPRNGQTYSASMELRNNGTLKLRGYLILPLFGKSQTWTRMADDRGGC
jgi:uncharacterized protein (DUF2147 family)